LLPSGRIVGAAGTDSLGTALASGTRGTPAGARAGSGRAARRTRPARPCSRRSAARSAIRAGGGSSSSSDSACTAGSTRAASCLRMGETDRRAGKQRTHGH
jgi:hypothetical protein